MIKLDTGNFKLELSLNIFRNDLKYPLNTMIGVYVYSDEFSANTRMDAGIDELYVFANDLLELYKTLSGEARLEEPYGMHDYIEFKATKTGHIAVKGKLTAGGRIGNMHEISFENEFDQTYLGEFTNGLLDVCGNV